MNIQELENELQAIEHQYEKSELEWAFQDALKDYKGDDEVISFKRWQEINKGQKRNCFLTGLNELDTITGGFHAGDLITITGETGQGKTSFSQYLTIKLSENKMRSLWFSYEMPIDNFLQKFETLPDGYLPKVLLDRNIVWIERKIVEAIAKYDTKCVFIDHLHYLFNLRESKNVSLEIGDIMRNLKLIAKKYNITIFIMAHTGKSRDDGSVGIDNIRDSSFVAQESDYVIAVWRVKKSKIKEVQRADGIEYTSETKIFVAKNRYTGHIASISTKYNNGIYEINEDYVKIPTQQEQENTYKKEIKVNEIKF